MLNSREMDVLVRGILVVDDDATMRNSLARVLRTEGFGDAILCGDPRDVEDILNRCDVGVVLLDLIMPHLSGEVVLEKIMARWPEIPVIMVTATDEVDTAVRCVKAGAFDYLVKPVNYAHLLAAIARALQQRLLRVENRRLQELIQKPGLHRSECFSSIITRSPVMTALFRYIDAVAPSPEPVLIVGETGTGKELLAQAVHRASGRAGELISVNVAGIDEVAFSDTLFGHVKGAFTGAAHSRAGMIEQAGDGTIFLDEIGDVGMDMQTKLLRLIQEGDFFPLGSDQCQHSHCRIIAATNQDLRARMRDGLFREDLFYRLCGHLIRVPALRERTDDIPLLVDHFMQEAAASFKKPLPSVPKELLVHLTPYSFPGNVRELRAMVLDAVARHEKGVLSLASFHEHMDHAMPRLARGGGGSGSSEPGIPFGGELPTLERATHLLISEALQRTGGNQGAAARLLGVSRRTVIRYLSKLK